MSRGFQSLCVVLSLGSSVLGCGSVAGEDDSSEGSTAASTPMTDATPVGTTVGSVADSGSTSLAGTSGGSTSESGADTIAPPVFDFGGIPDSSIGKQECTKVDFLFIIDNSSSMGAYQTNLVSNFPGFIDGIQSVLDNTDSYQVGVITTDPYTYNVPGCGQLSSLVVQTGGASSSGMMCGPYDDGYNFMTENDDLAAAFSCAARVGTSGSGNEMPMQAMVEAVQRLEGGPGECNEGFLREDSLLVIVDIGDEYDNSPGTPMSWYDDVVAARSGIPENVVVVSIIDGPGNPCGFGASVDRQIFTTLWGDNGFEVPICIADYAPYFQEAISIIDVACENYIPPAG